MSMVKITNEFIEETDDLKSYLTEHMVKEGTLETMEPEGLVCIGKLFKLTKTYMDLCKKQAEIMDSQNEKLDELLRRTKDILKQNDELRKRIES